MQDPYGARTVMDASWSILSGSGVDWIYGFQGLRYDSVSGTFHARHREVSPTLMRPMQVDMLRFAAGDVNFYRWEGNGPVGRLDPSGLDFINPLTDPFAGRPDPYQRWELPPGEPFPGPQKSERERYCEEHPPAVIGSPIPNKLEDWSAYFQSGWLLQSVPEYVADHPNRVPRPKLQPVPAPWTIGGHNSHKPTVVGVGTNLNPGTHQFFTLSPGSNLVGSEGALGCVVVIIQYKNPSGSLSGAAFHFNATTSAYLTLMQYSWPADATAMILGGNNDTASAATFWDILRAIDRKLKIPYKVSTGFGLFLAPDGQYYIPHPFLLR